MEEIKMYETEDMDFFAGELTQEALESFNDLSCDPRVEMVEVMGSKMFDFGKEKMSYDTGAIVIKRRYFFIIKEDTIDFSGFVDLE